MGTELQLRVDGDWPPTDVSPETFLQRLPQRASLAAFGVHADATPTGIELRGVANTTGMPDVVISIEPGGFYLLDNGALLANIVLAELVRYLAGTFDRVTIEAL